MADIFDAYALADAWDEMFERPGEVRTAYEPVLAALQPIEPSELRFRADQMARAFTDRGVTYAFAGEERPWPLDLVPRILDALEWDLIQRGVSQRVRALEAYLADAYGPARAFEDGVVPWRLLLNSPHFHRAAHGVEPPGGVRIHVAGIDLVRDEAGDFRVLEDNVRVPSGVSYVIENRRAMTRIFPSLFAEQHVLPVDGYCHRLLAALRAAAPDGVQDPRVVVLTPGPSNAAYFEHALLARLMGVQLVEGHDLVCRSNRVWMRTTRGEVPVHVVYRRLDDDFLDPLHFRPDSVIGCPGIMGAALAGNVTLANAVGNGIADDKLLYTYVPDLIRYYLSEEPILPNVESFRPGRTRPVGGGPRPDRPAGRSSPSTAPAARASSSARRRTARPWSRRAKAVIADPRGFIAQRPVALSTSPTLAGERMAPRHIDLRPFAVNDGNDVWVLPGGLTRVALQEGNLIVNSSQGGGSKDTWVLAEGPTEQPAPVSGGRPAGRRPPPARTRRHPHRRTGRGAAAVNDVILSRIAEALTWTGRYVERADATGRILDAYLHRMLEDPWRDEDVACRSLYAILGMDAGGERVDMQQVLDQLAFDARSTGSIEGALGAARLNARSAREAVSSEMWECLNSTWHALADQRLAARRTGPYAYLELVRRRAALFFGLADSTMSRDDSWRFVVLGRSLERVDMTVRLLSVRVLDAAHAPDWPTLLSASRRRRGVRARLRRLRRHLRGWPSSCSWTATSRAPPCTR